MICVERGVPDSTGIAIIARAFVPDVEQSYELGIGGYVVTAEAVFWEDIGNTAGATETHLRNGAVYRFDLATREVTTVADGLSLRLRELFVDHERAYSATPASIDYFGLDDATAGAIELEVLEHGVSAPWFVQNGSVFYAPQRGSRIDRFVPGEPSAPAGLRMLQLDEGLQILSMAGDGQRVFIETQTLPPPDPGMPMPAEQSTRLWVVDEDGDNLALITQGFRGTDVERRLVASGGWVYATSESHTELIAAEVATGRVTTIASHATPRLHLWSASNSFAYYTLDLFDDPDLNLQHRREIWRVARGSAPELLHRTRDDVVRVREAGGYLYWVEGSALLRMEL